MLVPNWSLLDCDIAAGPSALMPDWRALTGRTLAPSGHHAPELISAALRHWPEGRLATVRDSGGLRLVLPLARRRFPVTIHQNWSSPVNFHGLPHLDRGAAEPALAALLRHLRTPLLLQSVPTSGPMWEALTAAADRMMVLRRWERAVLRPEGTYAAWFDAAFERKRRKEYRRLQARLSEQGRFEAASLAHVDEALGWADAFLDLESAGWKGARGTAMKASSATAAAFREACRDLAQAGTLRFWKLALDGKPIAMMFAIADGDSLWLGKIAYDEAWARFSPGVLLILRATEQIFAEGFRMADSCAIPDHPMINHLWRDRLEVADVIVAASIVPPAHVAAAVAANAATHALRRSARILLNALSGRHRS